ncbi:MAG: hypothetical protein Q4D45_03055 [Lachnospiraceae bacterium]|nr:hypothetical protein [Lachnospiraceae bacterium]
MKYKKKVTLLIVILITISIYLKACGNINMNRVEAISIEVINSDEKSVKEEIPLKEEDVAKVKNILSGERPYFDSGFVFEAGKYRIVLKTKTKEIYLYPYCGDVDTISIGYDRFKYYGLEEEEQQKMYSILDKYIDTDEMEGIWGWESLDES